MTMLLLIGALLGLAHGFAAHQHHRLLLSASGAVSKVFWVLSTALRLVCVAGIIVLLLHTTNTHQAVTLAAIAFGYISMMFWLNRRP